MYNLLRGYSTFRNKNLARVNNVHIDLDTDTCFLFFKAQEKLISMSIIFLNDKTCVKTSLDKNQKVNI